MTVTTDCYWSIDGVPLQTYAYNITTLGGDREGVPPLRGEDFVVPYKVGQVAGPRIPDARTITLGMWVVGAQENGDHPPEGTSLRNIYNRNLRKLRRLFWQPDRQFVLTKRFEDDNGDIITASALGRYAGGFTPDHQGGPYRAVFTVDIRLADPFFFSAPVTVELPADTPTTIEVPGDWRTFDIEVDMDPGTKLTNRSTDPYVWMYMGGQPGTVMVKDFRVVTSGVSGLLTHGGMEQWFTLLSGDNDLLASRPTVLRYRAAYL